MSIPSSSRLSPGGRAGRGGVVAIALATSLALAPLARAADTAWTGATGSAWGTSGNWTNGVPTSADNAQLVSGASNTTISLAGANVASQVQVWAGSTYTLSSSAPATLAFSDQLYMFSDPTPSALTVSGSLAVSGPNGAIGTGSGDVGGTLTMQSSGASVAITNTFNVGYDGTGNLLDVSAGTFTTRDLVIGTLATATGNTAGVYGLVGGSISATNSIVVGSAGSSNLLEGQNGSITVTGPGGTDIGTAVTATNNAINLTGATFTGTGTLIVGRAGDANSFNVSNGSVATTGQVRIGLDAGADNNTATVSGTGSQWTANGTVRVGSAGSGNQLQVLSGGTMTVAGPGNNLWIGYSGNSGTNSVTVDGVGSVLDVSGVGSEIVISGSTTSDSNRLNLLNSGSVNVNSVQLGPGGSLVIGSTGTNPVDPGFLKSSATITGNLGPDPNDGGGTVFFNHQAGNLDVPNQMSGPLLVYNFQSNTTLTGSNSYTGPTVSIGGTLALGPSASIAQSGTILVGAATFDVSAVTGGYVVAAGQTLAGDAGTVIGPATGAVGSVVELGFADSPGTLTFTGGFSLLGDLKVNIDGSSVGLLDGSSDALTLGGSSSVTFNVVNAPVGDLVFAKYLSLAGGSFGTVNGVPSGYSLDYNYLGGNQIALVAGAVPEIDPASAGSVLALFGGALGLLERRRQRRV